jgi:multidrug efflux pump subunit AcrA (membrane-fusion protein)
VEVSAEFAGAKHIWQGQVMRLGGAIDERSRRVPVVVEIPDPYCVEGNRPPLVEGMFVEVRILGQSLPGAVAIPRSALRANDQVWVIDPNHRLQIRDVTVARAGVEQAIITKGLQAGEKICVSSLQFVSNGMLVRLAGEPAAPVTSATNGGSAGGDSQ